MSIIAQSLVALLRTTHVGQPVRGPLQGFKGSDMTDKKKKKNEGAGISTCAGCFLPISLSHLHNALAIIMSTATCPSAALLCGLRLEIKSASLTGAFMSA